MMVRDWLPGDLEDEALTLTSARPRTLYDSYSVTRYSSLSGALTERANVIFLTIANFTFSPPIKSRDARGAERFRQL